MFLYWTWRITSQHKAENVNPQMHWISVPLVKFKFSRICIISNNVSMFVLLTHFAPTVHFFPLAGDSISHGKSFSYGWSNSAVDNTVNKIQYSESEFLSIEAFWVELFLWNGKIVRHFVESRLMAFSLVSFD